MSFLCIVYVETRMWRGQCVRKNDTQKKKNSDKRHRNLCPCPAWHCFGSQDINMYAKRCIFFVLFMQKPVCAVFIVQGKMIYTKKNPDMRHRILCPCTARQCFGSQDINMYAKRQIGIRYRYSHVFSLYCLCISPYVLCSLCKE